MGNSSVRQENPNSKNYVKNNEKNKLIQPIVIEENIIFNKIINISNELLSEYNNNFKSSSSLSIVKLFVISSFFIFKKIL
jgi:hypothetical protein